MQAFHALFKPLPQTPRLIDALNTPTKHITIQGLVGSALSQLIAQLHTETKLPLLFILSNKEEAAYYLNDLQQFLGENGALFYPGSYRRPYDIEETDNANVLLRSEVLSRINTQQKPRVVVTYPEALFEKVVTRTLLKKNTLQIKVNDALSIDFINEILFEYHFKRVDFVSEPGEFAVRGGILDVFSFSNDLPYRIEFFGDDVESIRTFDVATQLSIETVKKIQILPNLENKHAVASEKRIPFLNYLASKTVVFIKDPSDLKHRLDTLFKKALDIFQAQDNAVAQLAPHNLFCDGNTFQESIASFVKIEPVNNPTPETIRFNTQPQPSFNKQFNLLIECLNSYTAKGYENYILCSNTTQAKRFHDIFEDTEIAVKQFKTEVLPLHQGFINHDTKTVCFTDHQLFERYHKFHLKNGYSKKQALTLKAVHNLQMGDYVTHIDHGIGKFAGLKKIDVEGKPQEAIKLIYGERDILYVSIHALHKISKYNGKDGKPPKLYKLGSVAWKKLKTKTKARVKQIAFNLIELYAKRKTQKGYAFGPDSYLQHELESSFIYEDTPDQDTATNAVKKDMESQAPMDRLICGDVGFGKTEIAIRAAFKAVDNGKQVAVLVPTTILAFQHYNTFTERLKNLPVRVDYLNRFRTPKARTQILEDTAKGKIDILIGTHQITSSNLHFKELGLLIIDEEQKFGVAIKDKLKTLKETIDTLTLTATPIPRTLQFSLMAARDLSVITTPPPNRFPVETRVERFTEHIIRDAIQYEISRGGQVYFVHNRVENIQEIAGMIQRLVPDAKIGVGHGQLNGKKLEALMLAFMNNEFDVLVATTIIESGLDVPNANTILINQANHFGLSDLHQMRGRVGRSNKKAFCYFITPPLSTLTPEARKRLTALAEFTALGSGFQIAMKDLEIRGAGDLLGGEQSGFINEMGFETYQKILNEAIEELKEKEFKTLYASQPSATLKSYVADTTIDTDLQAQFPDAYINTVSERLALYTALSKLTKETQLQNFVKDLVDRFGPLPPQAENLIESVRLKWACQHIGIEKIVLKNRSLIGYFIADQTSPFYQSTRFTTLLNTLAQHPEIRLKEKQTRNGLRLLVRVEGITTIKEASALLNSL